MKPEDYGTELSIEDMQGISGGALSEERKAYIQKVIRLEKRSGNSLEDFLPHAGGTDEEQAYIESVWDQA